MNFKLNVFTVNLEHIMFCKKILLGISSLKIIGKGDLSY